MVHQIQHFHSKPNACSLRHIWNFDAGTSTLLPGIPRPEHLSENSRRQDKAPYSYDLFRCSVA